MGARMLARVVMLLLQPLGEMVVVMEVKFSFTLDHINVFFDAQI